MALGTKPPRRNRLRQLHYLCQSHLECRRPQNQRTHAHMSFTRCILAGLALAMTLQPACSTQAGGGIYGEALGTMAFEAFVEGAECHGARLGPVRPLEHERHPCAFLTRYYNTAIAQYASCLCMTGRWLPSCTWLLPAKRGECGSVVFMSACGNCSCRKRLTACKLLISCKQCTG